MADAVEKRVEFREASATRTDDDSAIILVADDDPDVRRMLTDVLQAHGFSVIAVARGEDTFEWLDSVDLVLLDALLPGRDGWDICREIKNVRNPLLPVIMVTARTEPEDVVRTFAAGADDYVAKPFEFAELTARIKSRLRVHRAELAVHIANRQLAEVADQNYRLFEQARRDAEERALLLRELDHRVRNNLSVIMGLVRMERNRQPQSPAPEAFARLENRLRSFILVHEALRRQNYRGVPIRDVAERMAQHLRNSVDDGDRIRVEVTGGVPVLGERQGFALALVLNELITNSLQHGFGDEGRGCISISISEEGNVICIDVADDGVGDRRSATGAVSLGSGRSIVEALVHGELGGTVEYPPTEKGSCVRLLFPQITDDD
ncbi:MAG TPA: response regulator [Longimicrobiales bacterium]|nr:response regulator [Longimicrobiales bacterium]